MLNNPIPYYARPRMIAPIRPTCSTCRFFFRFSAEAAAAFTQRADTLIDDSEVAFPVLSTDTDSDLLEYGRCIRNTPQFLGETLNGDWPIVHETRVCGEYRPSGATN